MKQKELRALIVQEWDRWLQTQPIGPAGPTSRDSLKFFVELQDKRSSLVEFRSRGRDKWRIVHGWLVSERRIFDEHGCL